MKLKINRKEDSVITLKAIESGRAVRIDGVWYAVVDRDYDETQLVSLNDFHTHYYPSKTVVEDIGEVTITID